MKNPPHQCRVKRSLIGARNAKKLNYSRIVLENKMAKHLKGLKGEIHAQKEAERSVEVLEKMSN